MPSKSTTYLGTGCLPVVYIEQRLSAYDSKFSGNLSPSLPHQLAALYKLAVDEDEEVEDGEVSVLPVNVPYVQQQSGGLDCCVFAIAFALHSYLGHDVAGVTMFRPK
jgi:hypothetical protein